MKTLLYVHDPMCSWCWGFDPVLKRLLASLPEAFAVRRLLGGLAPDSDAAMPQEMRDYVQGQWRQVQQRIPGTVFNYDFWTRCRPRRSTYPACRAVISARRQGAENDERMTRAIQRAYYTQARNPSDEQTLLELAGEIGLDVARFAGDLASDETDSLLKREIEQARSLGVAGFPSLLLLDRDVRVPVPVNYTDHRPMLEMTGAHATAGP